MHESKLQDFAEKAEDFLKLFDRLENYKLFCFDKISESDKKLSDLDHMLELEILDCIKMTKLASKRKQILQQRRIYKDETDRANAIASKAKDTQSIHNQLQAACNEVKATNQRLSSRTYTPRVLYEDFGVSEEEQKKIEQRKADVQKFSYKSKSGRVYKPSKKVLDLEEKFREIAKG